MSPIVTSCGSRVWGNRWTEVSANLKSAPAAALLGFAVFHMKAVGYISGLRNSRLGLRPFSRCKMPRWRGFGRKSFVPIAADVNDHGYVSAVSEAALPLAVARENIPRSPILNGCCPQSGGISNRCSHLRQLLTLCPEFDGMDALKVDDS